MVRRKKRPNPLRSLGATALGLGGLGLSLGVSAAVAGKAATGTPAARISSGFGQIASGARIAVPIVVGGILLRQMRKRKGGNIYGKY